MPGSPDRTSFTPGRVHASPSDTPGGSRVPELGPLGSVRGALSNGRPYRDLRALAVVPQNDGVEDRGRAFAYATHHRGTTMKQYAGIDVSLDSASVCIVASLLHFRQR